MKLVDYLKQQGRLIDRALIKFLPADNSLIACAMRYSICAGGKRLRPILVIEGARLCGGTVAQVLPAACALEFIHTYSLIHDDLPAMDNDDLRRGKPTSHKKFGEAAAILAGDALLTDAFRLMSVCADNKRNRPERVVEATAVLSVAAGYRGMIGGQAKDTIEQGTWHKKSISLAKRDIEYIHLTKTAALIQASLVVGATLAGATSLQKTALNSYGRNIGLAFQIADDILDLTADKKLLGKRGSDRENNKLTYPALYGIEGSRQLSEKLIKEAKGNIRLFKQASMLEQLADYIVERKY
ncbi:MAG: polyprenyl synthetase family protein [Elusimicrobia bacterium]|nr:polyprenyl synthetase family protein [Elusimicrobiota bacterium]